MSKENANAFIKRLADFGIQSKYWEKGDRVYLDGLDRNVKAWFSCEFGSSDSMLFIESRGQHMSWVNSQKSQWRKTSTIQIAFGLYSNLILPDEIFSYRFDISRHAEGVVYIDEEHTFAICTTDVAKVADITTGSDGAFFVQYSREEDSWMFVKPCAWQ